MASDGLKPSKEFPGFYEADGMVEVGDGLSLGKDIVRDILKVADKYTAHESARLSRLAKQQAAEEDPTASGKHAANIVQGGDSYGEDVDSERATKGNGQRGK